MKTVTVSEAKAAAVAAMEAAVAKLRETVDEPRALRLAALAVVETARDVDVLRRLDPEERIASRPSRERVERPEETAGTPASSGPGRKPGHPLSAALLAAAGVGGPLEECARGILRQLATDHGSRVGIAMHLQVHERTVRRLCNALKVPVPLTCAADADRELAGYVDGTSLAGVEDDDAGAAA